MPSKEDLIFQAKLCEQAERYDDMVSTMEKVIEVGEILSNDDRNLLSLAYKNKIGARRSAWRILNTIENKISADTTSNASQKKMAISYKTQIESEIRQLSFTVVKNLQDKLIPNASTPESKVFYHKMAADYHRYRAEMEPDKSENKIEAAESSLVAYQTATETARELKAFDPVRLGLALNFSVFFYEVMSKPERACQLAKEALDSAMDLMDDCSDTEYEDAALVMRLLKDNLALWTEQDNPDGNGQLEDLEN